MDEAIFQATPSQDADQGCYQTAAEASEGVVPADAKQDPGGAPLSPSSDGEVLDPPCADPDPDHSATDPKDSSDRLDELRGELSALRAELAEIRAKNERAKREYEEFAALYPDVSLADLPDAVRREVEAGLPLAAAYALEERRRQLTSLLAEKANASNRNRSSGGVKNTQSEFFTPEEVRTMSQSEVRANLSKIMRSMKKWR